jgi:ABC-type dipeptide/oligopeptide/nickel transport system permease component
MTLLWNRRALANKTFNPFCWKREHQIALVIALFLGDVLGMLIATHFVDSFERVWDITYLVYLRKPAFFSAVYFHYYWMIIALWGLFGAAIAGALVYIRQLLRA